MNLVNLDGLTLIGPGSEWFWSMLQLVVVAVSLFALYRQVRLQSSASAIEQTRAITSEWNVRGAAPESSRHPAGTARRRRQLGPLPARGDRGREFWERVGWLGLRTGKIDRRIVHAYVGAAVRLWWQLLAPNTQQFRELQQDEAIFEHFGWLATTMAAMDRPGGIRAGLQRCGVRQRARPDQHRTQPGRHPAGRGAPRRRGPPHVDCDARDRPSAGTTGVE